MFPRARLFGLRRVAAVIPVLVALVGTVAACSSPGAASFNPAGPCVADGHLPGAYPELESRVPAALGASTPVSVDSGRNCSAANLGSLAAHGVNEVRFAGAVWRDAAQSGLTLAVFQAPGLRAEWIGEWYEASARAGRSTGSIQANRPTVTGRAAYRMDLVNGESKQTVIAWPSADGAVVQVVIAADEPEARIQDAIAAFP